MLGPKICTLHWISHRNLLCGALTLALSLMFLVPATAQLTQEIQPQSNSWKRIENGQKASATDHWTQQQKFDGELDTAFEHIWFEAFAGIESRVSHSVAPAFIIPELEVSVRVKSARQGVRLSARVVLPNSKSSVDGKPLTTILRGPVSRQRNKWETLQLADRSSLQSLLESRIWVLRSQHGGNVTTRGAYIDHVILELYTGPGPTSVAIADLKLKGIAEARSGVTSEVLPLAGAANNTDSSRSNTDIIRDPNVFQASAQQDVSPAQSQAQSLSQRDGTVLLVNRKPFFARIIQYNGEDFAFLKAIGFNTIELNGPPDKDQLAAAKKYDLWLIAPPPASIGIEPVGFEYDRVLAWSMGTQLASRDTPRVRQRIQEIRESDRRRNRPIFGHVKSHHSKFASLLDVMALGQQPLGSSQIASRYGDWLISKTTAERNSRPFCADIQTQYLKAARLQAETIFGQSPPTPVEYQQIKFLAAEAVTSGARMTRFRSESRLDSDDLPTRLRSESIQYTLRWLDQLEPWVAGGIVAGKLPATIGSPRPFEVVEGGNQNEDVVVTALNTDKARLLIVQRETHHEQFWSGDCPAKPIQIVDSNSIHTHRAYQLTDAELKSLPVQRSPEGNRVSIPKASFVSTLVMTQDANQIRRLSDTIAPPGRTSMFELHSSITQQWLVISQLIQQQLQTVGHPSPAGDGAITAAMTAMREMGRLEQQRSVSQAMPFLERADERLAFFRREVQNEALAGLNSKTSSPLTGHLCLVPMHWILAGQLPGTGAGINHLAGGDFENAQHVKRSGWANQRIDDPRLKTSVEFATGSAVDGTYGLKMSVEGRGITEVETPPVWVTSPPVRVKAGQLVRIHGWINVPQVIRGSERGLRIIDSFSGEELAESIPVTQGWQEFMLYRAATEDGNLTVRFQLTGMGQASIDEVTVRIADLPKSIRSARLR